VYVRCAVRTCVCRRKILALILVSPPTTRVDSATWSPRFRDTFLGHFLRLGGGLAPVPLVTQSCNKRTRSIWRRQRASFDAVVFIAFAWWRHWSVFQQRASECWTLWIATERTVAVCREAEQPLQQLHCNWSEIKTNKNKTCWVEHEVCWVREISYECSSQFYFCFSL